LPQRSEFSRISTVCSSDVLMRENSERWGKIIRDLKMTLD
jgi:hypothetical protein